MDRIDFPYLVRRLNLGERYIFMPFSKAEVIRWKEVGDYLDQVSPEIYDVCELILSERMIQEFNWIKMGIKVNIDIWVKLVIIYGYSVEELCARKGEGNISKIKVKEIENALKEIG